MNQHQVETASGRRTGDRSTVDPRPDAWREVEQRPLPRNLDELLLGSVESFSSSVLFDYFEDNQRVTYAEFGDLVDAMTNALRSLDVGIGSNVAVMLPQIPEFPALTFALARLRAVCVPINSRYTPPELDFVAADANVCALIIHSTYIDRMAGTAAFSRLGRERIVCIGRDEDSIATSMTTLLSSGAPSRSEGVAAELDDVCHIQYTSGTTGFPKGCLLTHRYWLVAGLANTVISTARRRLNDSPYSYMTGPLSVVRAMQSGGTIVVPRQASLSNFLRWLHEQHIDFCWFPEQLLKFPPSSLDRGHSVRHAHIYQLSREQLVAAEERFGFVGRNLWAMTETGVGTFVPWDRPEKEMAGSIGIPMPFREFKIVDADLRDVSDGEAGELCVRGPGMFVGYHNRPDANAELFLAGDWFRTGDRARRDENGWLYYLGRMKDMIRRSGDNIACGEVEHVLREMPEVADAAVLPVPDEWRDEEVKAYIVLAPGVSSGSVPPDRIYGWCLERLAKFKVPRYLEYRDELPRTPSGKVAKGVLVAEKSDLRRDSHDRVDGVWR
jgi:acyl-CoA synthetase (AMP-forming)/AMP-acid ligase II